MDVENTYFYPKKNIIKCRQCIRENELHRKLRYIKAGSVFPPPPMVWHSNFGDIILRGRTKPIIGKAVVYRYAGEALPRGVHHNQHIGTVIDIQEDGLIILQLKDQSSLSSNEPAPE